ncbi:MAG: phosphate signaling complex protein PhoU [Desulfovibrionaceae bacterium]|jgi:phosphate transport system protein
METRSHFHAELDALKDDVSHLAALVGSARRQAVAAYFDQDMATARQVVDGDGRINEQTCAIDEACLKLLALEQPVALDLRRIVGYARVVINLERLGDEAVTIAEAVLSGAGLPGSPDMALRTLADHVAGMTATTVIAFNTDDAAQALTVCREDTKARELAVAALRHITTTLAQCQASPEATVQAILATRSLERMAAHAANIAETVVFILQGATMSQKCQPR